MGQTYQQGLELLRTLAGDDAGRLIANLDAAAPGFSEALIAFAFAGVCARPGLDLKSRELITVATLAAAGNAMPQLRLHIGGALNVGCTQTEIVETLVQISLYAGIPATLNGLALASEVFRSREAAVASPPALAYEAMQ